ncbi:MAG: response regulator [Erythrobacter sp.]|nr:response regulator [Erythrobacter sp.]
MARIIFADDDPIVGAIVQKTLLGAGHAVGVVEDGEAAIAAIVRRRPDLLILDITMPGMTGSEVLDRVRRHPELWDLPVLMLTGRRSQSDEDIAIRAGATDYLRKPFDPDQLIVMVEALARPEEGRAPPGAAPRRSI